MNAIKPIVSLKAKTAWLALAFLAASSIPAAVSAANINWALTNPANTGTWQAGAATSWVGGLAPGTGDSVTFSSTNSAYTNIVDANFSIQDLNYLSYQTNNTDGAAPVSTIINPGFTLSVLGPNGLVIQKPIPLKNNQTFTFAGNALLVTNLTSQFVLNSGLGYGNSSSKSMTYDLSGLSNLTVGVNFFGLGNDRLVGGSIVGDQAVKVALAKTNIITVLHSDDYTQLDFTNAIEIMRQDNNPSTSEAQNSYLKLGVYNAFYAESLGFGRGNAAGNTATMTLSGMLTSYSSGGGNNQQALSMFFASSNSTTPTSTLILRNTNQVGRMKLLAVGVDSGNSVTNNRNNGLLFLIGGKVDALVDQIWLGRNRTNAIGNSDCGGLAFENGTINANTIEAGYMQFTNLANCIGLIAIGTNGTLQVNNYLDLGYSPVDPTASFPVAEANTLGQVQINNGGKLLANRITVGALSTNDQIIVNQGGLLLVSNNIADATKALTTLTLGSSAQLSLFVSSGVTNVFTTNLTLSGTAPTINILGYGGATSYPATNVLAHYQNLTSHPGVFNAVSYAPGFNNMQVVDDGAGNILLIVSTNAQKNLVWRGGQNSNWDHSSLNWYDTNSQSITKFTDNDRVVFDDTASVPLNVSITENVNPASVLVTNSVNQYVFNNNGGGTIGGATLTKAGSQSLELDTTGTSLAVTVNGGKLTGNGGITSLSIASGASINFGGTIASSVTDSGNATLATGGIINGTLSVNSGGTFFNAGNLNSTLSLASGTMFTNSGTLSAAGSFHITTNSIFVNSGTIYGNILTVDLGATLIDTTGGTVGYGSGSMNFYNPSDNTGKLDVFGTFIPGGDSIQITKVTDYNSGNPQQGHNGRVQLEQGSSTIVKINMDNPLVQTNTKILSLNQGFGGSFGYKSFAGCTLSITNIGSTPFAAGQSFKVFGYYGDDTDFFDAGLNTTNTYPVIQPTVPAVGLAWDLSQLIPHGYISIVSANDPSRVFSVTNSQFFFNNNGTNQIVTDLTWPADKTNAWVQSLTTTLTNGLAATNWVNINQILPTNGTASYPSAFEYITTNNVNSSSATFYRLVWP
jgi:hypothetical protein